MDLIGRLEESNSLIEKMNSSHSELVAIIGRRRIGKTFFVKAFFKNDFYFQFTGLHKVSTKLQLQRFAITMKEQLALSQQPILKNWFEAFDLLKENIIQSRIRRKKVIFFDEFPWIHTPRSNFLAAFTDFWNSFASARKDIVIIICGSAAAWMVKRVFKDKGGLYNRVTEKIELTPFTLKETEQFFFNKKINLKRESILKLYMVMGGVPFYLDQIRRGESADQAISRLFFSQGGLFKGEYRDLMSSLFDKPFFHEKVITVLSKNARGLDRENLLIKLKRTSGGALSDVLEELERSGFISKYIPFGKSTNNTVFKLTDPYVLFYKKYIEDPVKKQGSIWNNIMNSHSWESWSGLAFENICRLHIYPIKRALKIEGLESNESFWYHPGTNEMSGAEIDLIIDRKDKVINLCEIKYSDAPFVISKKYYEVLIRKMASFTHITHTRKTIFLTMITANGLVKNEYSLDLVKNQVSADQLFT